MNSRKKNKMLTEKSYDWNQGRFAEFWRNVDQEEEDSGQWKSNL
jgi:hypothetical protein